jgi:hypothetical protein
MQIFLQEIGIPGPSRVPGESGVWVSDENIRELIKEVCKDCIVKCCCSARCSTYFAAYVMMISKIKRGVYENQTRLCNK